MSPFDAGTKSQSQPLNNSSEAVKSTMLTYDAAAGLNPIQKLADQITVNTQTLSTFYRSQNLPPPSFERDSPTVTVPQSAPDEVIMARQAVMEAALSLFQLMNGPSEYLLNLAVNNQYIASLRWLTHFAIFSLVPLTEEISYSSVAASAGVSERQLKTVARMAMTNRVLCEPTPGMIAHTATSATFVTNPSLHDWAIFMCEASVPAAAHMVEASKKWPDSSAPNETAYNVAFDTNLPFFDHLATLPIRTKQFAGYMKNVTNSEGTAIRHLLNGFNWAGLGTAHVVDVGGSTGNSSIALAQVFPNLRFTVQDLPGNVTEGAASLAHYESSISSRIEFRNHDFFQPQPVIGADVFLLRMILHDWATPEAMKILRNLLPALRGNSRVLIMDTVLPPPGSLPSTQERMLRARDMTMQQVFNSMERDLQDWEALLAMADERLELVNVVHPSGSVMSILEVVLRG